MQRNLVILCLTIIVGIFIVIILRVTPFREVGPITIEPHACTLDAMICPDGSAVGRTGPNCEFAPCPTPTDNLIIIDTPQPNQTVTSPITISGKARGPWYFEATFPIVVVDWDGLIIGEGFATAQGDWMTTEFVPFTASVTYSLPSTTPYKRGAVIIQKSNASGLPEHDDAREIPILFE